MNEIPGKRRHILNALDSISYLIESMELEHYPEDVVEECYRLLHRIGILDITIGRCHP